MMSFYEWFLNNVLIAQRVNFEYEKADLIWDFIQWWKVGLELREMRKVVDDYSFVPLRTYLASRPRLNKETT